MMYTPMYELPSLVIDDIRSVAERVVWEDFFGPHTHWQKGPVKEPLLGFPNYVNAFFVKLPAKVGHLHRHHDRDLQRPCPIRSFNVVIDNNDECISGWYDEEGAFLTTLLKKGWVYLTDRDLEHESFNRGETDRLQLLVEMPR